MKIRIQYAFLILLKITLQHSVKRQLADLQAHFICVDFTSEKK
jgi:hypothetical protein